MKLLMLLLLAAVTFGSEDNPLPSATQAKIKTFNQRVERLRADFVKKYQTELDKVLKDLERDQKAITKKGDLEGALAVKKIIDELKSRKPQTDILGNEIKPVKTGLSIPPGRYTFKSESGWSSYCFVREGGKADIPETKQKATISTGKDDSVSFDFGDHVIKFVKTDNGWSGKVISGIHLGRAIGLIPSPEQKE